MFLILAFCILCFCCCSTFAEYFELNNKFQEVQNKISQLNKQHNIPDDYNFEEDAIY